MADGRKIVLSEKIDKRKLCYIIQNHEKYNIGKSYYKGEKIGGDAQLTLLKDFYRRTNSQGIVKTVYYQIDGKGRYFTRKLGLQGISRQIRHTIASEFYYDIDIKNAHPVFLSHYCNTNGMKCTKLDYYIANRDELIKSLMTDYDLDKDQAKKIPLCILNGKDLENEKFKFDDKYISLEDLPDWVQMLYYQIQNILATTIEKNPELYSEVVKKRRKLGKDYNHGGGLINKILCDIENNCLMVMHDHMKSIKKNVGVLCFDGLMNDKAGCDNIAEIVEELQRITVEATGINLEITLKEMNEGLNITPEDLEGITEHGVMRIIDNQNKYSDEWMKEPGLYSDLKDRWEQIAFFAMIPKTVYYVQGPHGDLSELTKKDLVERYEHIRCEGPKQNPDEPIELDYAVSFIKKWMIDPSKRMYNYTGFFPPPLRCPEDTYNLWAGFPVERFITNKPIDQNSEAVKFMLNHILMLVARQDCYEYLVSWTAQLLQEPAEKPGVAVLLYTETEGTGKGLFVRMLTRMLGTDAEGHFLYCDNPQSQLYGQFTAGRDKKLLIQVDEANSVNKSNSNQLKSIITEEFYKMEYKGKDAVGNRPCFNRILFTTNNHNCLKVSETDRRLALFDCSSKMVNNTKYFDTLRGYINDDHSILELFTYLMNYKIKISLRSDRPQSALYNNMKASSVDPFMKWLACYVIEENHVIADPDYIGCPITVKRSELYKHYKDYIESSKYPYTLNRNEHKARMDILSDPQSQGKLPGFDVGPAKSFSVVIDIDQLSPHLEKYVL